MRTEHDVLEKSIYNVFATSLVTMIASPTFRQSILATALIVFPSASYAADHVINFDDLASMTFWAGNPIPGGARLSDQYVSTLGINFSSAANYVAVVNLGDGHATSGTNGIGGSTTGGVLSYTAPGIDFTFFDPSRPTVPAGTNLFSVRGDLHGAAILGTLTAYDLAGNLIGSVSLDDSNGGETYLLSSSTKNIHRVNFTAPDSIALDDVSFNSVQAVPEPASLVVLGLAALTTLRRTSRDRAKS